MSRSCFNLPRRLLSAHKLIISLLTMWLHNHLRPMAIKDGLSRRCALLSHLTASQQIKTKTSFPSFLISFFPLWSLFPCCLRTIFQTPATIMSSIITKVLVAALAFGAAQALPNPVQPSQSISSVAAASSASTVASPAATPVDNTALIIELETAPTAIRRFQKLLTAAGQKLLSVAELQKIVVFDFNGATPNPGAKGMSYKYGS